MELVEEIKRILKEHPDGIKARVIADELIMSKSIINSCLYRNRVFFSKDEDTNKWFLVLGK